MKFEIIEETTRSKFEEEINEYSKKGFIPMGNMTVTMDDVNRVYTILMGKAT